MPTPVLQASFQVFTSSALFAKVADFIPAVPYFVLEFKTHDEIRSARTPDMGYTLCLPVQSSSRKKPASAESAAHAGKRPRVRIEPSSAVPRHPGHIYTNFGKKRQRRVTRSKLQMIVNECPLRTIQWIYEHNLPFTAAAMNHVAFFGCLDIVEFLHANRTEGCTSKAMDDAARNGHLDIVKFLHENRHEQCTSSAMVIAASRGHLNVLRFLHENRSEECGAHAMLYAVKEGHFECIKYLHEHKIPSVTTEAMDHAVAGGYLDIVKFLHGNGMEGCKQECLLEASSYSHRDVGEYVRANCLVESPNAFTAEARFRGRKELIDSILKTETL